jgi:acetylornithine/N-succinyldiaminopimelate aminotransferase
MSFFMSHILPTYANFPLTAVRGKGARLWDSEGKCYLDFCAGIATCSIGHCHPALSQAISDQASTLMHCSNLYQIPQQKELARVLVEDFTQIPGKVFFGNSGAEANDGMIKTARRFGHARPNKNGDARYEVITFNSSFHGRTLGSMAATAQTKIHQGFDPLLPGFRYVPFNDIEALQSAINETTAGIMLEPIQGEGGVNEVTPEFLQAVEALCKDHDLLLMLDEIQCGLGRTGTLMGWHAIYPELKPDTISWAKGLGGGFPVGAFYVSDRAIDNEGTPLSSIMDAGSHGSTYGGNPLACAAALAVLNEIQSSKLSTNAANQEQRIRTEVKTWNHPAVLAIRGKGLLLGFALDADALDIPAETPAAVHLCKSLMSAGLLTVPAGPETLRWLPPLNITDAEVDEALKILKKTLDSLQKN